MQSGAVQDQGTVCENIHYLNASYRNFPKFSDRQAWANSADPDQTAPRGTVWSGSTLFAIPSASFECITLKETPSCSTFRVITTNFLGVWIFRKFTVISDIVPLPLLDWGGQLICWLWLGLQSVTQQQGDSYRNLCELPHDKTNNVVVCPTKTQISLGIRPVWSESSLCTQWVTKDPSFLHEDSKDSDQTGRMPRLIRVFARSTTTLLVLSWGNSCIRFQNWKET